MHVFDLGILQWAIGSLLWALLLNNAWGSQRTHAELRLRDNLHGLRARMRRCYTKECKQSKKISRIHRLTLAMLSSRAVPRLKAKAAETRHLLPLAVKLTKEFPNKLGPKGFFLTGVIDKLNDIYLLMQAEPRMMSPSALGKMQDAYNICVAFVGRVWRALVPETPHGVAHDAEGLL